MPQPDLSASRSPSDAVPTDHSEVDAGSWLGREVGLVCQNGCVTRLLVLGGSWFLGPAIVEDALARGWEVTTFRRGQSGQDVDGVELIRGDRTDAADLARLAKSGPWDAVVDTSGYVPREVLAVTRTLEPVVGRYVFISSVSVYEQWPLEPLTEDSPFSLVRRTPVRTSGSTGIRGRRSMGSPRLAASAR